MLQKQIVFNTFHSSNVCVKLCLTHSTAATYVLNCVTVVKHSVITKLIMII